MLELDQIHTYYGDSHILRGLSLKVKQGSVTCLLGRNGAGKTTLISSIIGFNPPRQGRILFKGLDINGLPSHEIAHQGIGLVPQGRRIFKRLTVFENLKLASLSNREANKSLEEIHSYFPVLRERNNARGDQLSGGEQQMLAIGRALIGNPDLLLMDEPSEGLAPMLIENIGSIINKLAERRLSILLSEQNISMVLSLADYIYLLSNGTIVHESTPELLKETDEVLNEYLGIQA